jgi:hypothetical protein
VGVVTQCPVCQHHHVAGTTCPQCDADLGPLIRLEALPRRCVEHGRRALDSSDSDRAIALFSTAAVLDPTSPGPLAGLGEAYAAKGWLDDAAACFERALALAPADAGLRDRHAAVQEAGRARAASSEREASGTARLKRLVWALPVAALGAGTALGIAIPRGAPGPAPMAVQATSAAAAVTTPVVTSPPAEVKAVEPPPPPLSVHTVRPGESLWTIARARYGTGAVWRQLWDANRAAVAAPERLAVGQTLSLPAVTLTPR